jgi:predicted outer membrane protein
MVVARGRAEPLIVEVLMRSRRLELAGALACASLLHGCDGAPASAATTSADDAPVLTDAQVALVLLALNRGEVITAGAAEPNLRLPAVDGYARRAIADHRAAAAREEALLAAAGITPQPSALSDEVDARTLTETLVWVLQPPSRAYDLSYICTEIGDDARAVPALDRLAVTVSNAELRAETLRAGELLAQHLSLAAAAISAQGGCLGGGP